MIKVYRNFVYPEEERLIEFAKDIEQQFFTVAPYHFKYPDDIKNDIIWDKELISEIKELNKPFLSGLTQNANLYMIYTRVSESSEWKPKYFGQRKSQGIYGRIIAHLVTKNEATGAKLGKVKEALRKGEEIGINLVKITPEELRLYIEGYIIKQNSNLLDWNNHSKNR
ncbi:hypothetical protein JOC25_002590 [Solibacillus kalamii]|uniref:hypothetical protein n=1 Tax=Solibacillus kalamii TaxID=1748298 RepID=UPI0011216596|nr:hypothetical protein [Solibacillus kalamii]MBM7666097.1 hypothetical protein [Solibacillus kalamii]